MSKSQVVVNNRGRDSYHLVYVTKVAYYSSVIQGTARWATHGTSNQTRREKDSRVRQVRVISSSRRKLWERKVAAESAAAFWANKQQQ